LGEYTHFTGAPGLVRSSAYAVLGNGLTKYIVLFATIGAPSCPPSAPSENVHATRNCAAFVRSI
jgi:hypothetical protein